jgi:hypothetical protein
MAYDGWIEYNGVELVNLSRTTQLAETLGIDTVQTSPASVAWIQTALGGVDYDVPSSAPWFDPDVPASAEFAGILPLGFPGLDDSTTEATTVEYITDGGRSGKQRNATLTVVASVAIIASTDRGADYGKRWMDRLLRNRNARTFCSGVDMRYFQYARGGAPIAHRRDVRLTRGSSITRKRSADCSVTWLGTFTLVCDDPFEYSEAAEVLVDLGTATPTGTIVTSGVLDDIQQSCPVYDYSPIYDPLYPALVPSPTVPDFYPAGWAIADGMTFHRYWARLDPFEPSGLDVVPLIVLTTNEEFRMVRVSIWPSDAAPNVQCDPLFSTVVSYIPGNSDFYIDGEQRAAYVWDGFGEAVRRTDSLIYSPDAQPVEWTAFNDNGGMLVTLDLFDEGDSYVVGDIKASLSLIAKSD